MKGAHHRSFLALGDSSVSTRSPTFWRDAFRLRTDDSGTPLRPQLLTGMAEGLLEAGKASLLLHAEHRCKLPTRRQTPISSHALQT